MLAIVHLILRLGLGGIFLLSGLQKVGNLDLFCKAVEQYQILSPCLSKFYSYSLPWLEVLCGLYLILGLFTRWMSLLSSGMLVSFLIALGLVLLRGQHIDCGCFIGSTKPSPVGWDLVIRDIVLLAMAAWIWAFDAHNRWSLDAYMKAKLNQYKGSVN